MTPIHYTSEQPADYAKALSDADTLAKLREVVADWKDLAADAVEVVEGMSEADFKSFRKGMAKERRGIFAGEKFAIKYGAVQLPAALFKISILAVQYHVPWGLMYTRLKETGNLEKALA